MRRRLGDGVQVSVRPETESTGGDVFLIIAEAVPPVDFDHMQRDLLVFAERAGFRKIELTYEAKIEHGAGAHWGGELSWDAFLRIAPNPLAPTLAETMDEALSPEEADRFVAHMRPLFDSKEGTARSAVSYLRALR